MKKIIISTFILISSYFFFYEDSSSTIENEFSIQVNSNSIHNGNLIVVNKDTKLQHDPTNLTVIPKNFANNVLIDSDYYIEEGILEPLRQMFQAAESDGIYHFRINSAYRDEQLQAQLYEENGSDYAQPAGFSEHQTGLAVDIGSTQGTMDTATEAAWLAEHAAEFGFILRYPAHKIHITGISFEPWHYRYVGLPHSIIMKEKDLTLEEYITLLKQKKEYSQEVNGVNYFIQYEEELVNPETNYFDISGDNQNGYIVTTVEK
ncbi:M15 family metallopeptidase [Lysinibacillus endophyticus]|uniref:M15 family metallopeptidase n=1 Tax=Ureibacillus endophyticus TaxID=1978490 RepID=UPI00209D03B8|nr:M15 family metallopeptidase [Lysinibacillus endophyticus]MCP1144856.1 M15 family metallopeptidase [Lysinibacillus endophyticus]